jgi:hypothetical protein
LLGAGGGIGLDAAAHAGGGRRRPGREDLILLLLDEPEEESPRPSSFPFSSPSPPFDPKRKAMLIDSTQT